MDKICLDGAKFSEQGPATGPTEGTSERSGSIYLVTSPARFPWATGSEGSEQIPKGSGAAAVSESGVGGARGVRPRIRAFVPRRKNRATQ